MIPFPGRATWVMAMVLVVAPSLSAPARAGDWIEPTVAELALDHGQVETGTDAEALLWEITVDDRPDGHPQDTVFDHYLRIKIFTPAGAQKYSNISVLYPNDAGVSLVRARTVAPDGTRSLLARDAVFEVAASRSADETMKSTSFAIPNVSVGSIVEVRYRETRYNQFAHFLRLPLQLDIPVVLVRYNIRPALSTVADMHHIVFNASLSEFERTAQGFYSAFARDMPAFVEEPYMPPADALRASLLVYYAMESPKSRDLYWQQAGARLARRFDDHCRPNKAIRELAARLLGGGAVDEDALHRIFDWCRQNIHNLTNDALEDRPMAPDPPGPNKNAAGVLDRGSGTADDVNLLFASLARAAGFDVRLARAAGRGLFDPSLMVDAFLDTPLIAIHLGDGWWLLDPGALHVPFGALRWQHEGSLALLCDEKSSSFVETRPSEPAYSLRLRTAHLTLARDGTLEGEVHTVLTGQANSQRRAGEADESLAQRKQDIVDRMQAHLATAEVESVLVADVPDTSLRYEETLHLRLPDYGAWAGERLLLQPSVFRRDIQPLFVASERHHPVCFGYSWTDVDSVEIELPPGFAIDPVTPPKPLDIQGIGRYAVDMRMSHDGRKVTYVRILRFGDDGTICFPVESYPGLKAMFEAVQQADATTLSLFDAKDLK